MQISVADAGTLRKQITVTFDASEIKSREDQLLERYAGQMNMKGFRRGKVPAKLVRQRFGSAVRNEVQDALSQDGMSEAMKEHKLSPVGPVETESNEISDEGFKLVTSFDVSPEISLPDGKDIEIPIEETGASAEEIDEELSGIAKRSGEHTDIAEGEALQRDDAITLTGKLSAGEETVRDIQDLNHLLGAYPLFGKDPEEVVAQVEKLKVGDVLEFDTTLPETFKPEQWAGKDCHVAVTIQRAQRMQAAEINDEFAKKLGAESAEQLRERVEQMISSRKEQELHGKQMEQMIAQLIEKTSFELPPKLYGDLVEQHLEQEVAKAKQGDEAESEEDVRSKCEGTQKESVEKELRQHLLVEAIADTFEVQATQQDLNQQITMAAYQSGRQPQEVAKQLQESGRIMQVMADIRHHKALETMLQKVLEAHGVTAKEPAEAEA
ncbi:MAG: trigger factor [Planctomycetota bacterium]|jgi:trigger factor|nr:trigger factor [Planctomycetota bacterium]